MELIIKDGYKVLIDDEDYDRIKMYNWFVKKTHDKTYAIAYLKKVKGKTFFIRMHRLIMGVTEPKIKVDHKDHDGLNNKKSNLRACTNQENLRNRESANKNSKSQYLGVGSKFIKWTIKKTGEIRTNQLRLLMNLKNIKMIKEQEGPVNALRPAKIYTTCSGCKWHSHNLVKSGDNPIYRDDCKHSTAPKQPMSLSFTGNLRNNDHVIEPGDWCPFNPANAIDLV